MKIAFVSYEYPPETALGGIATYVEQAAQMLAESGHQVEVFSASLDRNSSEDREGVRVHRIRSAGNMHFYREVFPFFLRRHREIAFDVLESPDYKHDGYWIAKKIIDLPHVVHLHSGNYSSLRLFDAPSQINGSAIRQSRLPGFFRSMAGALRRGMPWRDFEGFCDYCKESWNEDINDRRTARAADLVVSPSLDLLKFQMKHWDLDPGKVALLPHPYVPSPALLDIACGLRGKTIGFFGQMSERKGLRAFGQALPFIFRHHPDARFLFVGRDCGLRDGTPVPDYLRTQAGAFAGQLEFTGQVALKEMPREYARVDLCVFPSIWENFPNVCLEAMSAGRAVIASRNGGMAEILDEGRCGLLISPHSSEDLAQAILQLLEQPELCLDLGQRARRRVLECYSRQKIAPLQEQLYRQAIAMHRKRA
jgi:glycosyltransferase involved in cell wall biosynthesis